MELDEVAISRAIIRAQMEVVLDYCKMDAAVVGAGQ
jgi:ribulose 1,5-bisphosphate synthetase/thiazole synthase